MSLRDRVQTDITAAMRGGDALRRDVLRMATNAAYNVEKRNQQPLTDDEFLAVLTREVKTRRESVEAYTQGRSRRPRRQGAGRDRHPREYLPAALSEAEIDGARRRGDRRDRRRRARATWARSWAGSSPRTRGRADGKVVSGLVAQRTGPGRPRRATTRSPH